MKRRKAELVSVAKRRPVGKDCEADREVDSLDQIRHRLTEASRQLEDLFEKCPDPQPAIDQSTLATSAVRGFSTCIPVAAELVSSKRRRDIEMHLDEETAGGRCRR